MTVTIAQPEKLQFNFRVIESQGMPPSKIKDEPYSWDQVRQIVKANKLEAFARSSAYTSKYLQFKKHLIEQNSSVFKHLLVNQLQWYDPKDNKNIPVDAINSLADRDIKVIPKGNGLFEDSSDIKVLYNFFPYYFEEDVVHLCVWTKFAIPSDPNSPIGDMSQDTKRKIQSLIDELFVHKLSLDPYNICWFRNWEALQSVKAISHVHVLIKGVSRKELEMKGIVSKPWSI